MLLLDRSDIDRTVGAVGRQIGYVYRYAENIQNLQHKVEELSIAICNIQGKIEDAGLLDILLGMKLLIGKEMQRVQKSMQRSF